MTRTERYREEDIFSLEDLMQMSGVVYFIENKKNGKGYVGKTEKKLKTRIKEHCYFNKKNIYIDSAIKKHDKSNFNITILECCETDIGECEKYWIKHLETKYPFGYNLTDGGDGKSGFSLTEETKLKISKATSR